jgi:hypothetical protein
VAKPIANALTREIQIPFLREVPMEARLTRARPEKALQASRPKIRHEAAKIPRSGERKANALTVGIRIPFPKEVPIVDRRRQAKPAKDLRIARLDQKELNPLSERKLARLLGFRRVKEGGTFVLPSFFVYIGSGPGFGQIAQGEHFKLSEQN